jgi:hypothetical protein
MSPLRGVTHPLLLRFSKNVQEFELQIASMVVAYDPDEEDVSSVVSVGSTPPGRSRSSTAGRSRAVSVSDTNYAIIRQTLEVSLLHATSMFCRVSPSHNQEQRMLEQMELMNSALAVQAISARDQPVSDGRRRSEPSLFEAR